jgi:hypothetical protein
VPNKWAFRVDAVDKCTFCYHRYKGDGKLWTPACVKVCPTVSKLFGDLDDPSDPVAELVRRGRRQAGEARPQDRRKSVVRRGAMIVRNQVWGLPVAVEMTLLAVASFAVVWAYIFWRRGDVKAAAVGGALGVVLPAAFGILASKLLKPPTAGILVLPLLNPHANLSSWMVWGASGISLLILLLCYSPRH